MMRYSTFFYLVVIWMILICFHSSAKEFDELFKFEKNITLEQRDDYLIGSVRDYVINGSYIYICDSKAGNVKIYSMDGKFISLWGKTGYGPGEFTTPVAIANNENNIYVADIGSRKLNFFSKSNYQYQSDFYILDAKEIKIYNSVIYIAYSDLATNTMLHAFNMDGQKREDLFFIPSIAKVNNLISDNISFDINKNGKIYLVHEMMNQIYTYQPDIGLDSIPFQSPVYISPPEEAVDKSEGREKALEWIKSWTHILKIDYLEKSGLILINSSNIDQNFVDIYDAKGKPIYTGIHSDYRYLYSDADENLYFLWEDDQSGFLEFHIKQYQMIK